MKSCCNKVSTIQIMIAIATTDNSTTPVKIIACLRVGQTTLRNSFQTCFMNFATR